MSKSITISVQSSYYHGTDVQSATQICTNGINVQIGAMGELGTGFYIGDSLMYACQRAYLKITTTPAPPLCFKVLTIHFPKVQNAIHYQRKEAQMIYKICMEMNSKLKKRTSGNDTKIFLGDDVCSSPILDDTTCNSNQVKIESQLIANSVHPIIYLFNEKS